MTATAPRRTPAADDPAAWRRGPPGTRRAASTACGSKVEVDPATGAVIVAQTARALRCDENCTAVIDTGVRLERTITLGNEHAHADVRDRWVSADGAAHAVRVVYSHGAAAERWRFPGTPAFRTGARGARRRRQAARPRRHGRPGHRRVTFDPVPSELLFLSTRPGRRDHDGRDGAAFVHGR